ncbi:group I intron-associated PD-(D/E)XK endonuclease [Microbacterium oryzae]|uniref:group I intron-associated PD-(D/E)XK endonuclease n=1 Tax=Microbacterium oryzae TaxID=743009 RepID=UPI0025B20E65|nr:group I intron-associated PD-(D/E)XK endonuclease [Microbacterium oryzae]MDN3312071.1 group I intron-associated PD-(D/E)XK endonuclease [Microbacterium oryzae]
MATTRTYSDEQLSQAVAASQSWRGVLRELGLAATSAAAIRSVRHRVDELGIDHQHFRGRKWTDDRLREAVAASRDWAELSRLVDPTGTVDRATVRGHAARLGLDVTHLADESKPRRRTKEEIQPERTHLRRAGPLLAAAWFTLCGDDVSWPLEPCRYDLLVQRGAEFRRVQVKSSTVRVGDSWKVYLSTSRGTRRTYDPDEIDDFFIVDGDLQYHLIPVSEVGGLQAIHLAAYARFRLETTF